MRQPAAADRWTLAVIPGLPRSGSPATSPPKSRCPSSSPARLAASPVPGTEGFGRIRQGLPVPASVPKPSRPGPGRPAGREQTNRHPPRRWQDRQERATKEEAPQAG